MSESSTPGFGASITQSELNGRNLVAWLRSEAKGYARSADGLTKGRERADATAFAGTCRRLADELEQSMLAAAYVTGGDPNTFVEAVTRVRDAVLGEREACANLVQTWLAAETRSNGGSGSWDPDALVKAIMARK